MGRRISHLAGRPRGRRGRRGDERDRRLRGDPHQGRALPGRPRPLAADRPCLRHGRPGGRRAAHGARSLRGRGRAATRSRDSPARGERHARARSHRTSPARPAPRRRLTRGRGHPPGLDGPADHARRIEPLTGRAVRRTSCDRLRLGRHRAAHRPPPRRRGRRRDPGRVGQAPGPGAHRPAVAGRQGRHQPQPDVRQRQRGQALRVSRPRAARGARSRAPARRARRRRRGVVHARHDGALGPRLRGRARARARTSSTSPRASKARPAPSRSTAGMDRLPPRWPASTPSPDGRTASRPWCTAPTRTSSRTTSPRPRCWPPWRTAGATGLGPAHRRVPARDGASLPGPGDPRVHGERPHSAAARQRRSPSWRRTASIRARAGTAGARSCARRTGLGRADPRDGLAAVGRRSTPGDRRPGAGQRRRRGSPHRGVDVRRGIRTRSWPSSSPRALPPGPSSRAPISSATPAWPRARRSRSSTIRRWAGRRYEAWAFRAVGRPQIVRRAPCLGEHTTEILRDLLGLPHEEIRRLETEGILA